MEVPDYTFEPSDLQDPRAATEALVHWDDLAPAELDLVARHPVQGPRLLRLQQAEAWLRELASGSHADRVRTDPERASRAARRSSRAPSGGACPTPGELYDHGRGPGYRPLPEQRRIQIERHVAECIDCELLVDTLGKRPPLPLEIERIRPAVAARVPEPARRNGRPEILDAPAPRRRSILRPLVPLLAAASVAAIAILSIDRSTDTTIDPGALGLPDAPLLRGETQDLLLFPRDRVLAPASGIPAWLGFAADRRFEIEPVDEATEYKVEVFHHGGGAFDRGQRVARASGASPVFDVAAVVAGLQPGAYTWEAWAVVGGLDRRLGARDFEVASDPELERRLSALDPGERGRVEAIRLLHDAGYPTDARALARSLAPSAERDAYLGRKPGR